MGYKNGKEILPEELIRKIQEYVNGEYVYIPRKTELRKNWGDQTNIKTELDKRNNEIIHKYHTGIAVKNLSEEYRLSKQAIYKIMSVHKGKSKYMEKVNVYKEYFTAEYLMGPNCVLLMNEMLNKYPVNLSEEHRILDIGCGKGLTSYFLAKATGATIYANDFWVDANDNKERFMRWNMLNRIVPFQQDAKEFHFEKNYFNLIISADAYHYFGGSKDYFVNKILPFMKPGGMALLCVPGIKEAFEGMQEDTIYEWLGDDISMFHSCNWWKNIIGINSEIEFVETWELECFEDAWNDWLNTDSTYAKADYHYYDRIIKTYTNFIGIVVKKKG